jgi:hypothetical protein
MLVQVIKKNVTIIPKITETEQQQEQIPEITAQPPPPKTPENEPEKTPAEKPAEQPAVKPQAQPQEKPQTEKPAEQPAVRPQAQAQTNPPTEKPAEQPAVRPQAQPQTNPPTEKPAAPAQPSLPEVKPAETRDRSIYLIQEANMVQVRMNRSLKVSDTPLKDSINALLAGPTADERRRGMISLVPEGSKLLSAEVKGSTAVLNFNEEFRYNTRGSEGCAAQIKQIVWTATEFPNIQNVQFLIEGNIVDFLSEGVVINSPIGR